MQSFKLSSLSLFFIVILVTSAFGQDVTLSWDASPSPEVTGYNVYYKAGSMSFPFDGTAADQGASPVDVGNTLSTTLTGLTDGVTYYFTVTAYDSSNNQSTYSNIVSNSWIPSLLTPPNNAVNEPVPVTFQWETAPTGYNVTYTLYYGTNQNEVSAAKTTLPINLLPTDKGIPPFSSLALISLLGTIYLFSQLRLKRKPRFLMISVAVLLGVTLTACGGGGGSGDSTTDRSAATSPAPADAVLYSIDKGSSDYHQAFDLQAGTTYYWKVVATDTSDPNLIYESQVQSFTTESF